MPKETKTGPELEALILEGLRAQGLDAASIEVYALDEPGIAMSWTVRRLRLNKTSEVRAESALKRVVFALVAHYDLAPPAAAAGIEREAGQGT